MTEPVQTPNRPTVTYDVGYIEDHGADDTSPERHLWLAVIAQAGDDLRDSDPAIRRDALAFFFGSYFLQALDFAGLSRDDASWLRSRALELAEVPSELRQRNVRFLSYQGETRTMTQWAKIRGISIFTLSHRLRNGWTVARALSTPGRH